MKRLALALALVVASAGAASAQALRYEVTGFTEVEAARGVVVEVTQGPNFLVRAQGPDAENVSVRKSGSKLIVQRRGLFDFDGADLDVRVFITMPRISGLSAKQGAQLIAHNVRAGAVRIGATQGGLLTVDGSCTGVSAGASMGGQVNAETLACQTADASASMGGLIKVQATQSVEASASMGGQVSVSGAPEQTNLSSTMGGMVSID